MDFLGGIFREPLEMLFTLWTIEVDVSVSHLNLELYFNYLSCLKTYVILIGTSRLQYLF
jgi:hypothetical protein